MTVCKRTHIHSPSFIQFWEIRFEARKPLVMRFSRGGQDVFPGSFKMIQLKKIKSENPQNLYSISFQVCTKRPSFSLLPSAKQLTFPLCSPFICPTAAALELCHLARPHWGKALFLMSLCLFLCVCVRARVQCF